MKIAVLGAGMVGSAIAGDLAKEYEVTAFDISTGSLNRLKQKYPAAHITAADLQDYKAYAGWLGTFDLVITAVPGFMGYETLKAVILCGKSVADISFSPENVLDLHTLAKENNCTAITDCGVAPGISNYVIGRHNEEMTIDSFEIYVGGLPEIRKKPFEYKAPFSPVDVIEEYTRPARLLENGNIITKPAMSEVEQMDFEALGTLEAFNTDGLRSLLFTMPHIRNQKEKTLRYPGHAALIVALQSSGFFETAPVTIQGKQIRPLDFTSQVLINEWKLAEDEKELTVLRVILHGKSEGQPKKVVYQLLDRYDIATGLSSMSRTTGFTCTASANLIIKGLFKEKGVFAPESVGKHAACFEFILEYLKERGVICKKEAAVD